jgi:hypothetical protein
MSSRLRVVLSALLLTLSATPVAAQGQRVFVRAGATVAEIRTDPARLGDVIQTWAIPSDVIYAPQSRVVGGGRHLLLETSSNETVVLETITGAVTRVNVSKVIGVIGDGRELVTSHVIAGGGRLVEVVTTVTRTRRRIDVPASCIRDIGVAEQARSLVVLRVDRCELLPPLVQWIDIVSLDGAPTRERVVEVAPSSRQAITTNPEGTRLWVATSDADLAMPRGIALFDLTAGRLVTQTSGVAPRPFGARLLPGRNVLLAVTTAGLTAFDPESLRIPGTADAGRDRLDGVPLPRGLTTAFRAAVLADDDAAAVFVHEAMAVDANYSGSTCVQAQLIALDPDTGQRLGSRETRDPVTGQPLCALSLAMGVAPAAPAGFGATVDGARVTLTWHPSSEATHYEVDAGSAPGLRNLARYVTGDTSLIASGVPPGTYYVRVRALNYAGKGAYAAELRITVR